MRRNVPGQTIEAQMNATADGSAFASTVTVYVTTDGGTQAIGSVGSGICTAEGNGLYSYRPSQAETNGRLLAYTFIGTGAIPRTIQTFTNGDTLERNVAGQVIGVQMVTALTGAAFVGSVTASITGDAGTQATGATGSGACTHTGNGYHVYTLAQGETDYTRVSVTFTGTGAIPVTIQVFTTDTRADPGRPRTVLGWPCYSDVGVTYTPTLSGGSWLSGQPLTNLQDRRLGKIARSSDATTTSTQFEIDLGVARNVGMLALTATNLSSAALVRFRGSNSAGVFTSPVYDSGWIVGWTTSATAEDVDGINMPCVNVPTSLQSARYWLVEIDDTTNATGYVDLGRLFIAGAWEPSTGINLGAKIGIETPTVRFVTDGGAALYNEKPVRRYWDFVLDNVSESDTWNAAVKMQRQLGISGQLFFVYDANDVSLRHERSFLAVLRELTAIDAAYHTRNTVTLRVLEEL